LFSNNRKFTLNIQLFIFQSKYKIQKYKKEENARKSGRKEGKAWKNRKNYISERKRIEKIDKG